MKQVVLCLIILMFISGCAKTENKVNKEEQASSAMIESTEYSSEENYIVYDVEDSEIVEKIIENILKSTNEQREEINFSIYTFNDYQERAIWLAEAVSKNGLTKYYLYVVKEDKFIEIKEAEFKGKRKGMIARNQSDIPLYEEENLER